MKEFWEVVVIFFLNFHDKNIIIIAKNILIKRNINHRVGGGEPVILSNIMITPLTNKIIIEILIIWKI